jgi:hypothetical protein
MSIPDKLHAAAIRQSIDLARYEAGLRAKTLKMLDKLCRDLVSEIGGSGIDTPRTDWQRARLRELLGLAEDKIQAVYGDISGLSQSEMRGLVEVAAGKIIARTNAAIGADLLQPMNWTNEQIAAIADEHLIFGASSGEWWRRQSQDMAQAFGDQMRMGMLRGESLGELSKRVRSIDGLQGIASRNAKTLVRSSVVSTANSAHLAAFQANADIMKGIQWCATLDRRTCLVAGSLVSTPNGTTPIDKLKLGDIVIGGSGKPRRVLNVMNRKTVRTVKVTLSNGETIRCTEDHLWLNLNQKWVEAKDLKSGDTLAFALK